MHTIKITGVVAAAKRAREKLQGGIAAEHVDDFRRSVTRTITEVERICAEYKATPAQLPSASYQAYQFLKTLDLAKLPVRAEAADPAKPEAGRVRIKNLLPICAWAQGEINRIVTTAPSLALPVAIDRPDVAALLEFLTSNADIAEKICVNAKATPAALPIQSRQAYQWLRYLSDPDNLAAHLATLEAFRQTLAEPFWTEHLLVRNMHNAHTVYIDLCYSNVLYRFTATTKTITLRASEGFSGAPPEVIEALLRAAFTPGQTAAKSEVQAYSDSDDFLEIIAEIESLAEPPLQQQRGQHYDLNAVFDRVNALYFRGLVERPRLTWSTMHTARKMGHYQPHADTVMISLTLDDARAPAFVIDFVMYHELLHKQLGTQTVNGRRYSHTPTFRAAERRYPRYQEAVAFMAAMSRARTG